MVKRKLFYYTIWQSAHLRKLTRIIKKIAWIGVNSRIIVFSSIFLLFSSLRSCAPPPTPTPEPQMLNVYATSSAQPWLADVYACAPDGLIINLTDELNADMVVRVGEPEFLSTPAYRIDTQEILVVTHRQSPVQNMTVEAARDLFAGQGDPSVTVWVYASGEDVQRAFEQAVMRGRSITSLARLAVSPQHMSDVLNAEANAVGILPRHWKVGDPRDVYSVGMFPVLAIVKEGPRGAVQELLVCLQK